jgi:hypothetical protein
MNEIAKDCIGRVQLIGQELIPHRQILQWHSKEQELNYFAIFESSSVALGAISANSINTLGMKKG